MITESVYIRQSSSEIGLGVFSTRVINKGTVVWFPCSRCIRYDKSQIEGFSNEGFNVLNEYGYNLADGSLLMPCGNNFLLNHSCSPNVLDFGLDFGIAIKTIMPNEELTIHYATFQSDDIWSFDCFCGSNNCQKKIYSPMNQKVIERIVLECEPLIRDALYNVTKVDQPLHKHLIEESILYKKIFTGEVSIFEMDFAADLYSIRHVKKNIIKNC